MATEKLALMRGSGNVFRDLNMADADTLQRKALLAGDIIQILDRDGLTVRAAQARTQVAAAAFSRIRRADLRRLTVDRLTTLLALLN